MGMGQGGFSEFLKGRLFPSTLGGGAACTYTTSLYRHIPSLTAQHPTFAFAGCGALGIAKAFAEYPPFFSLGFRVSFGGICLLVGGCSSWVGGRVMAVLLLSPCCLSGSFLLLGRRYGRANICSHHHGVERVPTWLEASKVEGWLGWGWGFSACLLRMFGLDVALLSLFNVSVGKQQ
jgi:hypothetical protein